MWMNMEGLLKLVDEYVGTAYTCGDAGVHYPLLC